MAETAAMRAEATAAFDAVRNGDSSHVGALVKHGERITSAIAPYLQDPNADVRREAMALLNALDGKSAAQAAIPAINDPISDIRTRAARLVLRSIMRNGPEGFAGIAAALASIDPSRDAAMLLLLAFSPDGETALRAVRADAGLVKLSDDGPAVSATSVADIALSRRGVADARARLFERINGGDVSELEFLLRTVQLIDAPELLHALADKTLGDTREIAGGVPSGAKPSRRVADLAVEAFTARLHLQTGIEMTPAKRYSEEDVARVREAVAASVPQ